MKKRLLLGVVSSVLMCGMVYGAADEGLRRRGGDKEEGFSHLDSPVREARLRELHRRHCYACCQTVAATACNLCAISLLVVWGLWRFANYMKAPSVGSSGTDSFPPSSSGGE